MGGWGGGMLRCLEELSQFNEKSAVAGLVLQRLLNTWMGSGRG